MMVDKGILYVGKIARLIADDEEVVDWELILQAYHFEEVWEDYSSFFNGTIYDGTSYELIRNILKDAYLEDPDRSIPMMKYILIEELSFNEGYLSENINDFLSKVVSSSPVNSSNKNSSKKTLKVFISYSMKDKFVGAKIKEILESFGIECFMAHNDIGVSEEWKKRILQELSEADIFIPILSNEFKKSDWCSQEAGIACFRNILVIPLSIEKNIIPYGFMSHRQGELIRKNNIPSNYLINPILDNFPEIDILSNLIDELEKVKSFIDANNAMGNLGPFFNKLTIDQINKVIDISIENDQVYGAYRCQDEYLPRFIKINEDKIEEKKLKKLNKLIK